MNAIFLPTSSELLYMKLTKKEIYQIEWYIRLNIKDTKISEYLWRHKSTISRLFKEYPRDFFDAEKVIQSRKEKQSYSWQSEQRIESWSKLEQRIISELKERESPEQIAGRYTTEMKIRWDQKTLSKDTIYAFIYERYPELKSCLRRRGKKYRADKKWKHQIQDRVMIQERDKKYGNEITKRTKIWHWEWDTVIGKNHKSAIWTFLERYSGYWQAKILPKWKDALWMVDATEALFKNLPQEKVQTITFDNGREFAYHKMITHLTWIEIYFAEAYCSRQRWCNENWNGLARDYFPKGTDFNSISQEELDFVVQSLNSRPRKRLKYLTPEEVFFWIFKSCVPF